MPEEYEEYGGEWEKEMMKFKKRELIDMLRKVWKSIKEKKGVVK